MKKNSTGRVMTLPPNVTTNEMETIERELFVFKTLEASIDKGRLSRTRNQVNSMLTQLGVKHEQRFKAVGFPAKSFNSDRNVFGS